MEYTKEQIEALITHAKETMSDEKQIELGLKEREEWALLGDGQLYYTADSSNLECNKYRIRGNIFHSKEEAELADQRRILLHEMKLFCEEKNGRKIDDFDGLDNRAIIGVTYPGYEIKHNNTPKYISPIWLADDIHFLELKDKFQDRVKQLKLVI